MAQRLPSTQPIFSCLLNRCNLWGQHQGAIKHIWKDVLNIPVTSLYSAKINLLDMYIYNIYFYSIFIPKCTCASWIIISPFACKLPFLGLQGGQSCFRTWVRVARLHVNLFLLGRSMMGVFHRNSFFFCGLGWFVHGLVLGWSSHSVSPILQVLAKPQLVWK